MKTTNNQKNTHDLNSGIRAMQVCGAPHIVTDDQENEISEHEIFNQENIDNPSKFECWNQKVFLNENNDSGIEGKINYLKKKIQLIDDAKIKMDGEYLDLCCYYNELGKLYCQQNNFIKANQFYSFAYININKIKNPRMFRSNDLTKQTTQSLDLF